jgi:hypothetical protein
LASLHDITVSVANGVCLEEQKREIVFGAEAVRCFGPGTFSLLKDEIIQILVGQEGGINRVGHSSGGGGGTFVVRGSNTPLIKAGGGGGVEAPYTSHAGCDANTSTAGNPGYQAWSGESEGHDASISDGQISNYFQYN